MSYTQQELHNLLRYDPLTGELFWRVRPLEMFPTIRSYNTWNSRYAGKPAFTAKNAYGYHVGAINNQVFQASRIIYKMIYGSDPEYVDHIDGDQSNNRKVNLRDANHSINQQNTKLRSTNTSGVVGVTWLKSKKSWLVRIGVNGKSKHIGKFKNFDDAVKARKNAEIKYNYHPNHGR